MPLERAGCADGAPSRSPAGHQAQAHLPHSPQLRSRKQRVDPKELPAGSSGSHRLLKGSPAGRPLGRTRRKRSWKHVGRLQLGVSERRREAASIRGLPWPVSSDSRAIIDRPERPTCRLNTRFIIVVPHLGTRMKKTSCTSSAPHPPHPHCTNAARSTHSEGVRRITRRRKPSEEEEAQNLRWS